jgi:redox-sensitive bicupin YhaK (pirin superfamily)
MSSKALRSVKQVLPKPHPHWVGDGFKVLPVFADLAFTEAVSPFLMFDYGEPKKFEPQPVGAKPAGVGMHPHRGFETVTIAFQGEVEHRDSVGNHGVIGPGDTQWMSASRGIVHEEHHSKRFTEEGGVMEMCQLWVNLPRKYKMTAPKYQPILSSQIPTVELPAAAQDGDEDGAAPAAAAGSARIIAGELLGTKGPASTFSPVDVWDVSLPLPDRRVELPLPSAHNGILFVRRGKIRVLDGKSKHVDLGPQDVAILDRPAPDGAATAVALHALEPDTSVLVLAGEPLTGEPIVQHGPFVMNTREEIAEAIADYRAGRLGR